MTVTSDAEEAKKSWRRGNENRNLDAMRGVPTSERQERIREPLESLYREHWTDLMRLAAVVSGDLDAAPELVQEVFTDLTRDYLDIRNPAGWLRTAVVHRSRSLARRRASRRRYLERHGWEHAALTDVTHTDLDVRRALADLNADQRAVAFMRYYLDLPVDEIAIALGCPAGTVKSRLNRCHARLKEALADEL